MQHDTRRSSRSSSFKAVFRASGKRRVRLSVFALVALGALIGFALWGGFSAGVEATNSTAFCTGCHEMRDNVYEEYKSTVHYNNRTGVRVGCSDCHVPKEWTHKLVRKIKASGEVWGHLTGSIDTKEKFEARRMQLATNEWKRMEASGSRECRNCHSFDTMEAKKQGPRAQKKHAKAKEEGKTCIHCHKGIAHLLPAEYVDPEE